MRQQLCRVLLGVGFLIGMNGLAMSSLATFTETSCTSANGFYSEFDTPNADLSGYSGPFGAICITLNAAGTTATVDAETFAGFRMGDGSTLGLVVDATTFANGTITGDGALPKNGDPLYTTDYTNPNVDGFGHFNFVIDSFDGFHNSSSLLDFTLLNTSGTWATPDAVLTTNDDGADAVMHVMVCADNPCNLKNPALATGFAAEGPGTIHENPEPKTVALLGMALLGWGVITWRRRS